MLRFLQHLSKLLPAKRPRVKQPEVTDEVVLHFAVRVCWPFLLRKPTERIASQLSAAWHDKRHPSNTREEYEATFSDEDEGYADPGFGCRQQ